MAERKATNKYYPPDWDPSKGSINRYRNSHPLRERAKKLHLGILVIRFEMPYNIWCSGCKNHIGTGVRYNAEKSKVGMYYTTPVFKFRMKCHLCENYIEMQTDPANLDYIILSGATRQERRWDPTQNGQVVPEDKAVSKQLASDPMFKLDHIGEDSLKKRSLEPVINNLERFQRRKKDDYELNAILRKKFRNEKKERQELEEKDGLLRSRGALNIRLLPESTHDKEVAQLLRLEAPLSFDEKRKRDRTELMERPILDKADAHSVRKGSTALGRRILHSKPSKTASQMHSTIDKLRSAVKQPPTKRLFGFEDIDLPSAKKRKSTAVSETEQAESVDEQEEADHQDDEAISVPLSSSDDVECRPKLKQNNHTNMATSTRVSDAVESPPNEVISAGPSNCGQNGNAASFLTAYSDSDRDTDSD